MNCGFLVPDFVCGIIAWWQAWWLWLVVGIGLVAYLAALGWAKNLFGWPGVWALVSLTFGALGFLFGRRTAPKPKPPPSATPSRKKRRSLEDLIRERIGQ